MWVLNNEKALLPHTRELRAFLFPSLSTASCCRSENKKALPFHGKAFSV
jgi:isopentenyldiphosphate isomerase